MSAMVKHQGRGSATRPPIGLLLSIGDKTTSRGGKEIPTRIDWIRPKEGALEQYAQAVAKYHEVYGDKPKQLDDVFFLSNNIGDILNIRLMAWGSSSLRLVGDTNFATLPREEWEDRAFAFDDEITYFPRSPADVRPEIRQTWNGEPIRGQLAGPSDARIEKLKINVECTLTFCLPKILGFGTVAQITTKGRRSMRNLVSAINDQAAFFQGQLIGIPFRLGVQPARVNHFDRESRTYMPTTIQMLVLDTPFTVQQAIDKIRELREALGTGNQQAMLGSPEAAAFTASLALNAGDETEGEVVQLREEPSTVEKIDDALLNRIAHLESQVGDGYKVTLRGVFDVDSAAKLDPAAALQYEQILTRSIPAEPVDEVEVVEEAEIVDFNGEPIEFGEQA